MAFVIDPEVEAVFDVCGIDDDDAERIAQNEGFESLGDLGVMEGDKDVLEMAKRLSTRAANNGRVLLGTVQIKRLQALVWWVRDHQRRGLALTAANFTVAVMNTSMTSKNVDKELGHWDASIKDLMKFNPDDFDIYEDAFLNLLAQTSGAPKESIHYKARERVAPVAFVDQREQRMFADGSNRPWL